MRRRARSCSILLAATSPPNSRHHASASDSRDNILHPPHIYPRTHAHITHAHNHAHTQHIATHISTHGIQNPRGTLLRSQPPPPIPTGTGLYDRVLLGCGDGRCFRYRQISRQQPLWVCAEKGNDVAHDPVFLRQCDMVRFACRTQPGRGWLSSLLDAVWVVRRIHGVSWQMPSTWFFTGVCACVRARV